MLKKQTRPKVLFDFTLGVEGEKILCMFILSLLNLITIVDAIFHNKHPNNLFYIILINTPLALFTSHLYSCTQFLRLQNI